MKLFYSKLVPVLIAFLAIVLIVSFFPSNNSHLMSETAPDGKIAKWVNVDFTEKSISDFAGRVVLLEFWASW